MSWWVFVWLFGAPVVLAAAAGWCQDLAHKPRRERLLTTTNADVARARTMSHYYASIHGCEW